MKYPMGTGSIIEVSILAGGKSSRMGQDKGMLQMGSQPMIQYLLDTFQCFDMPLHIIANHPNYRSLVYPVYEDLCIEKGPMGGLYTALLKSRSSLVLLISCDSPFISKTSIDRLLSNIEDEKIIVSVVQDIINPLFAIYPVSLVQKVWLNIQENKLKMTDFILESAHLKVGMDDIHKKDPFEFYNINSPSDVILCKSKWK
ncbi:MAG: molybdenum cofactor guanylyltransferase [Saprospiraceae bacterium]|nr:molybdenum cofactor guanylyltransferase [Saprospiraceae bacterium]